jgi:cytochrome c peroxidase
MKLTRTLTAFSLSLITIGAIADAPFSKEEIQSLRVGLSALPPADTSATAKITLGKKLYSDTILSKAKDLSCNSCHKLDSFGVDNNPTSTGDQGQKGGRNSPTTFNAALHFVQFWDGRAATVEEQALGPIQNPVEMAMPSGGAEVVERLKADAEYVSLFAKAFPGEKESLSFANVGKAIGSFERTLITPSRYDQFVTGDDTALSNEELQGLKTFKNLGCIACHSGATLGGQMYQKLGIARAYETKDLGRYEVTHQEQDKFLFKVPSLRNIEKTSPYFHDGSIPTLEGAVKVMGSYQLGKDLSDTQVREITTFLKSLTATPS